MAKEHLYRVIEKSSDHFEVFKLDEDLKHLDTYHVSSRKYSERTLWFCDCYAGNKSDCRHRKMARLRPEGVYDFDKGKSVEFNSE